MEEIVINILQSETVEEAVSIIFENSETGKEETLNDYLYFGCGVYADYEYCKSIGLNVEHGLNPLFCKVNEEQVKILLQTLYNF